MDMELKMRSEEDVATPVLSMQKFLIDITIQDGNWINAKRIAACIHEQLGKGGILHNRGIIETCVGEQRSTPE